MNNVTIRQNNTDTAPLISVIIPAYQSEGTVPRAIASILSQDMSDSEIVIVDDGSTDGTENAVRAFGANSRIRFIKNAHLGVSEARNTGMREARGKFLLFCDADDEYLPDAFGKLAELAKEANDVTVFGATVENLSSEFKLADITPRNFTYTDDPVAALFDEPGARPYVWNSLYRREFLINSGVIFDKDFALGEDQLFQFATLLKAKTVRFSSAVCYKYYYCTPASCNLRYLNASTERVKVHLALARKVYGLFAEKFGKTGVPCKYYRWMTDFLYPDILHLPDGDYKILRQTVRDTLSEIGKPKGLSIKQKIKYGSLRNRFIRRCLKLVKR